MKVELEIVGKGKSSILLLKKIRKEMEGLSDSTIKQTSQTKALDKETNKLKKDNDKLTASNKRLKESNKKVTETTKSTANVMKQLRNGLLAVATVRFASGLIKQFTDLADTTQNLDVQLKNVLTPLNDIDKIYDSLGANANKLGTTIDSSITLYSRLARATKELGTTQDELLDVTNNISKAFVLSGSSTQETTNAMIQLSQGFSAGALRGDEFRATMEQAPVLIDALKDSLNVGQGALIKMAFAGELTSDKLIKAFTEMGEEIDSKIAILPVTTERAFNSLTNNLKEYIRESNVAVKINTVFANSVKFVADNLNTVFNVAIALAITGILALVKHFIILLTTSEKARLALIRFGATLGVVFAVTTTLVLFLNWLGDVERQTQAIIDKASELPSAYQGLDGVVRTIEQLNETANTNQAQTLADTTFTQMEQTLTDLVDQKRLLEEKANEIRETIFSGAISSIEGAELWEQLRVGEATMKGLDIAIQEANASAGTFVQELAKIGVTVNSANPILAWMAEYAVKTAEAEGSLLKLAEAEDLRVQKLAQSVSTGEKLLVTLQSRIDLVTAEIAVINGVTDAKLNLAIVTNTLGLEEGALKTQITEATIQLEMQNRKFKELKDATKGTSKPLTEAEKKLKAFRATLKSLRSEHKPIKAMLLDLNDQLKELESAKLDINFSKEELKEATELLEEEAKAIADKMVEELGRIYEAIPSIFNQAVEDTDVDSLADVFSDFAIGLNPAIGQLQRFKDELVAISGMELTHHEKTFKKTGLTVEFVTGAMANMAQEGSDAQRKLQAIGAVTNTILGISAILEQGKGDPYTAFARMASMAVLVASMGVQVAGAFGGSGGGGSEARQASQGTGTVLGDAGAKSESIGNSLDIIASASEKIVGINSSMLRSLKSMNDAISGTANEIAKLGGIGDLGTTAGGGLGGALSSIFSGLGLSFLFGSSKVTDRGIEVLSGSISDAINGDIFRAYEEAKKKGLFGSSRRINTAPLEEGITNQIGLIFQSMTDAILAGAEGLGVDLGAVQNALDAYRIEEQKISLKDLTAEEQQAELEAVFSSIFDGLVSVSIPFIAQFQVAGEGLGETLARVSTTVLVFEEAVRSMGLEFIAKQLDPELFAQSAVAIADFAGGLDKFIDSYTNYVKNFLSEDEQFQIMKTRITGVFDGLDIVLPTTREGFVALIQSLDLTTSAGQEAFAVLIGLSNELDAYYTNVEDTAQEIADAQIQALEDIRKETERLIKAQEAYLKSLVTQARRVLQLRSSLEDMASDLFGVVNNLSSVTDQIEILEQAQSNQVQSTTNAGIDMFQAWEDAIDSMSIFLDDLLIDTALSPLTPQGQLDEALSQFDELIARSNAGDVDAFNQLPALITQILQLARSVEASGVDYNAIFDYVTGTAGGITNPASPNSGAPPPIELIPSQELIDLYARRDALEAQELEGKIFEFADTIRQLVALTGQTIDEVLIGLGVGITDIVSGLNINLDELDGSLTRKLGQLANVLGIELTDLANMLEVDLGNIADANSLLNDGLEEVLTNLPDGIRDRLEGLLRDVEEASSPEEQVRAIDALSSATGDLPLEYSNALAPYFDDIDITTEVGQQIALLDTQVNWLVAIHSALVDPSSTLNLPTTPLPPEPVPPAQPIGAGTPLPVILIPSGGSEGDGIEVDFPQPIVVESNPSGGLIEAIRDLIGTTIAGAGASNESLQALIALTTSQAESGATSAEQAQAMVSLLQEINSSGVAIN
jgi:tape measure domain-containing protein